MFALLAGRLLLLRLVKIECTFLRFLDVNVLLRISACLLVDNLIDREWLQLFLLLFFSKLFEKPVACPFSNGYLLVGG